jgi:cytochrome c oxidase assembly protein subunit 15
MIHGCFAQASFCLIVFSVIVTGRWWTSAPDLSNEIHGRSLIRLAILAVCVVYGQLIIGAVMRHLQAGLAIPDLPWAYGKLIPPINASQLHEANQFRIWKLGWDTVSLTQIWLAFAHRLGAIVVSCTLIGLICLIVVRHWDRKDLVWPAVLLGFLLIAQVTLGILTVYLRKPADVASTHVAVGALVLVTTFTIAVRGMRLYSLMGRNRVAEATTAGELLYESRV